MIHIKKSVFFDISLRSSFISGEIKKSNLNYTNHTTRPERAERVGCGNTSDVECIIEITLISLSLRFCSVSTLKCLTYSKEPLANLFCSNAIVMLTKKRLTIIRSLLWNIFYVISLFEHTHIFDVMCHRECHIGNFRGDIPNVIQICWYHYNHFFKKCKFLATFFILLQKQGFNYVFQP